MNITSSLYIITAAGGNPTAIRVLPRTESPDWYAERGGILMAETAALGVEQAGFLIPEESRFMMSGGEFCGNAARAAAMLLARFMGAEGCISDVGYTGISAHARWENETNANVTCIFDHLPIEVSAEQTRKTRSRSSIREESTS